MRGGGLGSRPKKMYGERLGDGVEYHLIVPVSACRDVQTCMYVCVYVCMYVRVSVYVYIDM